jgi:hypothetical protein
MEFLDTIVQIIASPLVGSDCAEKLLDMDPVCVKMLVSKVLSLGLLAGGLLVKVPQILLIVKQKSGEGISVLGLLLESIAISIGLIYNYAKRNPFTSYGEGSFMLVQNLIIMSLILNYKRKSAFLINAGIVGLVYFLNQSSIGLLEQLQISTIFIGMASRLPQIWQNFVTRSTGKLSFVSTFLQFAGTVARIFTTFQEVGDPTLLLSYGVAAALNGILILQFFVKVKSPNYSQVKSKKPNKNAQVDNEWLWVTTCVPRVTFASNCSLLFWACIICREGCCSWSFFDSCISYKSGRGHAKNRMFL